MPARQPRWRAGSQVDTLSGCLPDRVGAETAMPPLHNKALPGESADYRAAREQLLQAEIDLRAQIERVADMRRKLPDGGPPPEDYEFQELLPDGGTRHVKLSALFDKPDAALILYSLMYGPGWDAPCASCTSITDGFSGLAPHVAARANFAVVSQAPPGKLKALAVDRGWQDHDLRLLSAHGSNYQRDYHAQSGDDADKQLPVLNVFTKRHGEIRHFWASELLWADVEGHPRHVDLVWPLWNLLDLTPEGRGDAEPKLNY